MAWGHLSSKMKFSPNRFAFCTSLVPIQVPGAEFDVQVVLVDDASDMAHLGKPLEEYTAKWTGRVHLIRSGEMD